jgi:hypothetical protein
VDGEYLEQGGSWRPFWSVAAVLAVLVVLDAVLPGPDVPPLLWLFAVVGVLGCVAAGCLSARRIWTVRVAGRGPDAALSVGRERLPLTDVDTAHLRAGTAGRPRPEARPELARGEGDGVLQLPLRRTDGTTVLVPTRAPGELTAAVLRAHPASTDEPGRVDP